MTRKRKAIPGDEHPPSTAQKVKNRIFDVKKDQSYQKDKKRKFVVERDERDSKHRTKKRPKQVEILPFTSLPVEVQVEILTFLPIRCRMDTVRKCNAHFYALVETSVRIVGHTIGFDQRAVIDDYVYLNLNQIRNLLNHHWIKNSVVSLHLSNMFSRKIKQVDTTQILSLGSGTMNGRLGIFGHSIQFAQFSQLKHFVMTETFNLVNVEVLCDHCPQLQYFHIPKLFIEGGSSHEGLKENTSVRALVLTKQFLDAKLAHFIRKKFVNLQYLEVETLGTGHEQDIEDASSILFVSKSNACYGADKSDDDNNEELLYKSQPISRVTLNSRTAQSTSWLKKFCFNGADHLLELNLMNIGESDIDDVKPLLQLAESGCLKRVSFGECPELYDCDVEKFLVLGCEVHIHLVCFDYGGGNYPCPCFARTDDDIFHDLNLRHENENKSLKKVRRLQEAYPGLLTIENEKGKRTIYQKLKRVMKQVNASTWNDILTLQPPIN